MRGANGDLPGGLPEGLGQVLHFIPGILVEQGIMLHDQEAVVVRMKKFDPYLLVRDLESYL